MNETRIWTVGHSTRSLDELLEILRGIPVERLVDVRTLPRSRRNPQFDRDTLAAALERAGMTYRHAPELGGLRKPHERSANTGLVETGLRGYADHMQSGKFARGVERLIEEAAATPTTVMCAEASPWNCHRALLSDALFARGIRVVHRLDHRSEETHRPHPLARIRGAAVTYPGLL